MTKKLRTTKRPISAREMAEMFGCSTRTVFRAWSQSREDYLTENSISHDKPWEKLGISRRTWYYRGKPIPQNDERLEKYTPILSQEKGEQENV